MPGSTVRYGTPLGSTGCSSQARSGTMPACCQPSRSVCMQNKPSKAARELDKAIKRSRKARKQIELDLARWARWQLIRYFVCAFWGRSRSARYFGGGGGRYPTLPNGSSMNNVTPTAAGRQAAGCPSVRAFGLLVRRIPRVVLSKAGVTTCSSGSGENWWLSITPGISTEKARW